MSRHTIATLYIAGVFDGSGGLAKRCADYGFDAATIVAGAGVWKGQIEAAYVLTIIGETETPAHIYNHSRDDGTVETILMPAIPTGFADRIRTFAENLTREYSQDCVAFTLAPAHFELTTRQAAYVRT